MMDELADFEEIISALKSKQNINPINISGVSDSLRAHLAFCVSKKLSAPLVMVAESDAAAAELADDLKFFTGGGVLRFGASDILFYDVDARSREVQKKRLEVLDALCRGRGDITYLVTSFSALVSPTLPYEKYIGNTAELKAGDEIEPEELCERLTALGYKREDMVEGAGQFSSRGGILDFFPPRGDNPIRIEFFDTEIDSIRVFDKDSQRTIEMIDSARITPAAELVLSDKERDTLIRRLSRLLKSGADEKSVATFSRDIERIKQNISFPSIEKYIPYIYKEIPTLIDYIPDNAAVFWCDPARISDLSEKEELRFAQDLTDLAERGIIPKADAAYKMPLKKAVRGLAQRKFIGISALPGNSAEYRPKRTFSINSKSLAGFGGKLELLVENLKYYKSESYRAVLLGGSAARAKNLVKQLENEGMSCGYTERLEALPPGGAVTVCPGSIARGFELPLIRAAVISDKEIFGGERRRKKRRVKIDGEKIDNFADLSVGDYVVHRSYGIGKYLGIEQLNVEGARKDYLKIQYKGGDYLYVPTDQTDMVFKHISRDGARVKLNKLGGSEWARTKQRVKAAAADMAEELIALYAERAKIPGVAFPPDDEWQSDFEARFPYEETDDQLRSIDEMKQDMQKPHPMDRLLCGDVGYGKTEVALRGAFKAVNAGYQVAYLVPTTILANQHYNTFRQRMKDYPINVAMLSRFCSAAEERRVVRGLATGEVDVVIGTHKLLGEKVKFKKLGMLIIDEEQRFGVAHKEKIKEMRKEVDVLTLSATPIPRTLHMSLTGIRDMSVINEPPAERFPVSTYVMEYDADVAVEAINKELGRGGQVYYLFNKIDGIFKIANNLAERLPNARIGVAHGRMNESELERIMMDVQNGDIDVLVCTTIIETGLDIPNVNTLIVENADRLGLAQLYQLRGRVGRSNRAAYAYLTYRKNKMLTPEAEKRLLAIKEFTEFGSGFKIAMRDLEIRGAGSLIGASQHGHMEAVGYEMYCRLLEEARVELTGGEVKHETETQIDLPVTAYISEDYIENHSARLAAYKRIASVKTEAEMLDAYDEIEDRYGTVPPETNNLLRVSLIKSAAEDLGISEMIGSSEKITIKFDPENPPDMAPCIELIEKRPGLARLISPTSPRLILNLAPEKTDQYGEKYLTELEEIIKSLQA